MLNILCDVANRENFVWVTVRKYPGKDEKNAWQQARAPPVSPASLSRCVGRDCIISSVYQKISGGHTPRGKKLYKSRTISNKSDKSLRIP